MFNISDIFDKQKGEESPSKPDSKPEEAGVSSVVVRKIELESEGTGLRLYQDAFRKIKEIYLCARNGTLRLGPDLQKVAEALRELAGQDDVGLLKLCFSDYPDLAEYLYYHCVNVSILALRIASGLRFEREAALELGLAGLLHDIGLMNYLDIIHQSKVLTINEFANIKQHPRAGFEMLSKLNPLPADGIRNAVLQEHERIDGTGYPEALTESAICLNAQIVGLADSFEALTHRRPHREKRTPLEASKIITEEKKAFSSKIIKALFERVGIFPVGATVRLNTKELGIVLRVHAEFPLRPLVKVLFDVEGNELKEPKLVDLSNSRVLFIAECL
jgi:HD-GYP domain-containing protein (c-di-GMP phosphodiesterase class II)